MRVATEALGTAELDARLSGDGYIRLGGMSNRVYVHAGRGEVLKIATRDHPVPLHYRAAGFVACAEASARFASRGIMPDVWEVGANFQGTGLPFLRERYVPGRNLSTAYLDDPGYWNRHLTNELRRIYEVLLDAPAQSLTAFYDDKFRWLDELRDAPLFARYADIYDACRNATVSLRNQDTRGYLLHGDLQLGNLLVQNDKPDGEKLMLLDWELYQFLPLGFEWAHFWANLDNPVPQVEDALRPVYKRLRPLMNLWNGVRAVVQERRITDEMLRQSILVYRIGWVHALSAALHAGRTDEADELESKLRRLVNGEAFVHWQPRT